MFLLIFACTAPAVKLTPPGATDSEASDSTNLVDSTMPYDLDGDGFASPEDCDDTDSAVSPAASEDWDGVDQDCDGRVDGDGDYSGTAAVDATAIYEGKSYRFSLSCLASLNRLQGAFAGAVVCTPDPADAKAQLLLGSTLTLSVEGTGNGPSWSGEGTVASSSGWDTHGDASAEWSDFDHLTFALSLAKVSLSLSSIARLTVVPAN